MEKLKHVEDRFALPDFKFGDRLQCRNRGWAPLPVTFLKFEKRYISPPNTCSCPTNGRVLITTDGYTHCIFSGKLTSSHPYGTLMWKLIDRKHP